MGVNIFLLMLSLVMWKIVWVDNYPNNVPKGNYTADIATFMDRKEFYKAESFGEIVSLMY